MHCATCRNISLPLSVPRAPELDYLLRSLFSCCASLRSSAASASNGLTAGAAFEPAPELPCIIQVAFAKLGLKMWQACDAAQFPHLRCGQACPLCHTRMDVASTQGHTNGLPELLEAERTGCEVQRTCC
jgi:hypothetical protein